MPSVQDLEKVLNKQIWLDVNRHMLAKMISEFMYEDMIHPDVIEENDQEKLYELVISPEKKYRYKAADRLFDSFDINPDSIIVNQNSHWQKAESAIEFLLDIQPMIGMSSETAGHLIKELNHTLLADAHILAKQQKGSDELVDTDYVWLEGEMTGHPWITYNKGRIGFSYEDYLTFAPENQQQVQLFWIAVHKEKATFHSVKGLTYDRLVKNELREETIQSFTDQLKKRGVSAQDYYFLPIHDWQWKNMIVQNFAEDLAQLDIIPLGKGEDMYLPQQSIRTFANITHKEKHHVKLPMSILNTLVYRGLPSERTVIAPKITEYIKGIYDKDPFLKEQCRVILPGEAASINYDHQYYKQLDGVPYQYLEMLGSIWRESIYTYLEEGERAITLAALLHIDRQGKPFVSSLIEKSGISAEDWIKQMFNVMLPPLLHYLYQYGTVFSPHGQNTILVIKDYKPHRLAIKDYVDDVNISDQPLPELEVLTEDLKAVLRSEPPEGLTQFIITGLFICHYRYLCSILVKHHRLDEKTFWGELVRTILNYQEQFPELQARFELFNLFKPRITKLCLNRNRMVDYGYTEGDDRPHASEYGKVRNALYDVQKE
ncbi:siderophore synthetase component [Scopulibacillus daqui]|uniref:Siderophore synthetase component n=1 Tax=Scopulibacillus daqui TaxID=1469162 RepID=A0ABS2PYG9_9BACL|nr:IucA/IucC family siderophore biosynthesis protein [Scopulibacillus daqui]MBM7644524.1 siderophore synthetase component [Scopulibacillus daqui]